ncbi:hypothetical protein [Nocardia amamiensis]|uniref:hypothetical protein n=1 Tax=Nocardia amamiensis TaxID=404578 RepID=UPI000831B61B|nr:hypothetical protein [Nocardia amamiensis]
MSFPASVPQPGKYARIERERRFLLADLPIDPAPIAIRTITDRYWPETTLRLRHIADQNGSHQYKLTQKIPASRPGPVQGTITNTYLTAAEFRLFAALPGNMLTKTRYSIPPFGIDVFASRLAGLILAEIEFTNDDDILTFTPPTYAIAEVTDNPRFTGGHLATTSRDELAALLADFGIDVDPRPETGQQVTNGEAFR